MLLPALKMARGVAREISCVGNLKQFGTANIMYAGDYSDWFPYSTTDGKLWDYLLMPYVGYTQNPVEADARDYYTIFHCPSGKMYAPWSAFVSKYEQRGYGFNYRLTAVSALTRKSTKITMPTKTVLMSDIGYPVLGFNNTERHTFGAIGNTSVIGPAGYVKNILYRHTNKTSILFADGHSKPILKGTYNAPGWIPQDVEW